MPRFEPGLVTRTINSILCPHDDVAKDEDVGKGMVRRSSPTTRTATTCCPPSLPFVEKAKNAVIIGCGHGGLCYNCSIDICVTSGMCPFCRADIGQVVTIGLGRYEVDDDGRKVVPVIGPK